MTTGSLTTSAPPTTAGPSGTTARPVADVDGDPVATAVRLGAELLRPQAEQVDGSVVPRSHLAALATAGLLGATAPIELGGGGHAPTLARGVSEELAAACGATWFVWAQHAVPLATAVKARHDCAAALASGAQLSGVAIAHLRRPGPPAVTATLVEDGWRFDGRVGWMTSWGICDVFLLAAVAGDDVVTVILDAREQPGLTATEPMRLAAMTATRTVQLLLDGLVVPDAQVLDVTPLVDWQAADVAKTVNASPHTFGLQRECARRLAATADTRGDGTAASLATALLGEGDELRLRAYDLMDTTPSTERVEDRLALRAESLELVVRTSTALVAATGGAAMDLGNPAQRLAREAVFHVVQAQTGPVREATLRRWASR